MNKIAIGEAFASGFRLIRRKPLVPLVWGLVYLVLFGVPITLASLGLLRGSPQALQPGANPMAFGGNMLLFFAVEVVFGLLTYSILNVAVFRAVLEPEKDERFYLGLGGAEGRQALVLIALIATMLLATVGLSLLVVILAVVGRLAGSFGVILAVVGYLAMLVVLAMIWVRLSLGGPLTYAKRRFALFESWAMSRSNGWRLFGLAALLFLILLAIYSVIIGFVLATTDGGFSNLATLALKQQQSLATTGGVVKNLLMTIVSSVVGGYLLAIFTAPWVDAFRQLSGHGMAEVFSDAPGPWRA